VDIRTKKLPLYTFQVEKVFATGGGKVTKRRKTTGKGGEKKSVAKKKRDFAFRNLLGLYLQKRHEGRQKSPQRGYTDSERRPGQVRKREAPRSTVGWKKGGILFEAGQVADKGGWGGNEEGEKFVKKNFKTQTAIERN